VVAPVTLIGLVFEEPIQFAVVATAAGLAGAGLLFVKPVETKVEEWIAPSRAPTAEQAARVSEYTADRAAATWGYSSGLTTLLASLGPSPPAGLIARLMATHPPTESRVARLQSGHDRSDLTRPAAARS